MMTHDGLGMIKLMTMKTMTVIMRRRPALIFFAIRFRERWRVCLILGVRITVHPHRRNRPGYHPNHDKQTPPEKENNIAAFSAATTCFHAVVFAFVARISTKLFDFIVPATRSLSDMLSIQFCSRTRMHPMIHDIPTS